MLLLRSIYFDSLNRLHWNKRCRIGQGSCELHEENALPTINLIQKSFNIFRRVISPMFPMHFNILCFRRPPDGHHIFFAVAGCGPPVASRPACENGTAPSPKRGQPREVRGVAPGDEDEELWGDEKTRKKNTDWKRKDLRGKNEGRGQGENTRDWCRSNIPNGESFTSLTHNYFTLTESWIEANRQIHLGRPGSSSPGSNTTGGSTTTEGWQNFHQFPNFVKLIRFRNEVQMRQGLAAAGSQVRSPGHKFSDLF